MIYISTSAEVTFPELFIEQECWVVKVENTLHRYPIIKEKADTKKKTTQKKIKHILFEKSPYGTTLVKYRTATKADWHLVFETRNKVKLVDDASGFVKYSEGKGTILRNLSTGKAIRFDSKVYIYPVQNEYFLVWGKKDKNPKAFLYQIKDLLLVKEADAETPVAEPSKRVEPTRETAIVEAPKSEAPEEISL